MNATKSISPAATEIWHAGDIGDISILQRLRDVAPVVRAVSGNVDHGMVRRECREVEMFTTVEGVKVWMTHIGRLTPESMPAE